MSNLAPRIAPLDLAHADAATAATLAAVKTKIGMVPNLFRTFAHSPTALNAYLGLSETVSGGVLSAGQREIVALAVAQANACGYCLAAHTAIGKGAGLSDAAIRAARAGKGLTTADAALATFAHKLTANRGVVSDAELSEFKLAGFDDGLVLEVVTLVALNTLTNYVNHLAGTEIDFPKVTLDLAA